MPPLAGALPHPGRPRRPSHDPDSFAPLHLARSKGDQATTTTPKGRGKFEGQLHAARRGWPGRRRLRSGHILPASLFVVSSSGVDEACSTAAARRRSRPPCSDPDEDDRTLRAATSVRLGLVRAGTQGPRQHAALRTGSWLLPITRSSSAARPVRAPRGTGASTRPRLAGHVWPVRRFDEHVWPRSHHPAGRAVAAEGRKPLLLPSRRTTARP